MKNVGREIGTKGGWGRNPQTTYVHHAWLGVGNGVVGGCVRAVPVRPPLPFHSTPTQSDTIFAP